MRHFFCLLLLLCCQQTWAQPAWWQKNWRYRLTAVVEETAYQKVQETISVSFPLKGSLKPDGSDVRVLDEENRVLPSMVKLDESRDEVSVFFRAGAGKTFTIYYGNTQASPPEGSFSFQPGSIIVNDYLHPEVRTTGSWSWVSQPRLFGKLAHTEIADTQTFHGTALIPAVRISAADNLVQYVLLDEKNPPEQIMLELWGGRNRFFFSWGKQRLQWRGLKIQEMGALPAAGTWQKLVVPLGEVAKHKELTGITFYHAGGKVVWDLTCLNEAAVPARVTTWQELDRPVSPYFLWEAIGPLKFSDQTFVVLSLNSLSGTENCRWRISGKEYSGSSLKVRVPPEKKLPVSLTVVDHQGQPLTLEKQLLLPQEKPEEIKVEMKDIPRPSFAYPREQVLISHQLSSMTAVPLPLEITADGKQEEVLLLPREENSRMLHHCLSLPGERKPFSVQVCLAGLKLLERKFLFLPLTEAAGVTCQGPFLFSPQGEEVIILVPDETFPAPGLKPGNEITLAIAGDYPRPLVERLFHHLKQRGLAARLVSLPQLDKQGYHLLSFFSSVSKADFSCDVLIFFPDLISLWRKIPLRIWLPATDAILTCLKRHTNVLVVCSPFPSAPRPEDFRPYAEKLSSLTERRNWPFVDLYPVLTDFPDWTRLFLVSEGVYGNFPGETGLDRVARALVERIISFR